MDKKARKSALAKRRREKYKADLTKFLLESLRFKRYQAKKKGIPFDLDEEWVLSQPKMCAVTGQLFEIPPSGAGPLTPSFDQKTAGLGYTKKNTQLICLWLNMAYGQWPKTMIHGYMKHATEAVHGNSITKSGF